jgi:hypothetical protein
MQTNCDTLQQQHNSMWSAGLQQPLHPMVLDDLYTGSNNAACIVPAGHDSL